MSAVSGVSAMRVQGLVIFLAASAAVGAQASSIETLAPVTGAAPSILVLGEDVAIDPSIVAAVSADSNAPSIVAVPDTPDTPSIVTRGEPAAPGEAEAAAAPGSQRMTTPMVIRGGEVGTAAARPSPAPAEDAGPVPLLDPNDRGTPAKRKALKRQAERLAQEKAAAQQSGQTDPSEEAAPLGQ